MPCRCDYPNDYDGGLRQEADKATRAACDMRTILRRLKKLHELTVETREWIAQHDEEDARRIKQENAAGIRQRVKQKALDKLSLEERRVFGVMKAYKVEILVIDHEGIGPTNIVDMIEMDDCLDSKVKNIVERDIGEWEENHPLNLRSSCDEEYKKLFR